VSVPMSDEEITHGDLWENVAVVLEELYEYDPDAKLTVDREDPDGQTMSIEIGGNLITFNVDPPPAMGTTERCSVSFISFARISAQFNYDANFRSTAFGLVNLDSQFDQYGIRKISFIAHTEDDYILLQEQILDLIIPIIELSRPTVLTVTLDE
jgi:hypothetical protein